MISGWPLSPSRGDGRLAPNPDCATLRAIGFACPAGPRGEPFWMEAGMASDNSGFKSLTEAYDNTKAALGNFFDQHFATVEKPQDSTYQASKSISLGAGFKANIGMISQVQEAFSVYTAGPVANVTLGALGLFPTTSAICTASANLNASWSWGTTSLGATGVGVGCTISSSGGATTSSEAIAIKSALVLTFQDSGAMAALIPGIDIAA